MSMDKLKHVLWVKCRRSSIFIFILLCLHLFYIFGYKLITWDNYGLKRKAEVNVNYSDNQFLVNTAGCRIPYLDPFDKSILKFIFKVRPFICSYKLPLVESDLDSIYIDKEQLPVYNINSQDVFKCCYQPFSRTYLKIVNISFIEYKFGKCKYFNSSAEISDEFVKVICKVNNKVIYKDFHSFVPIKTASKETINLKEKLNVLVVGLDSLSRLNFQRHLPHTKKYIEELGGIEMMGYNKVGDNTFPNLVPVLTGQSVAELKNSCWPTNNSVFDNCDFIWKNYSKAGYFTCYAEDNNRIGTFNYFKNGFYKQPTDYYWYTFDFFAEKEFYHSKYFGSDRCIGSRPIYIVLLDYIQKFVFSLRNESFFGFFWSNSLTHNNLNYPSQGDQYYRLLFEMLKEKNILNNTLLIVLSDHGMRWGEFRFTYHGYLEERLPCLFFVFPPWFKKKFSSAIANVQRNSKHLTTPFDLHETLADLLNTDLITTKNIKQRSKELYKKRGISLFLPVPDNRTCSSADIPPHWCACQNSVEISKTSDITQRAAEFIINYLNELLKDYKKCATLKLDTIMDSSLYVTNEKNKLPIYDYTVRLKAKPSGGIFEATLRCTSCNRRDSFNLTGTISRLNLYGNQSSCISDYNLKLYCYCTVVT